MNTDTSIQTRTSDLSDALDAINLELNLHANSDTHAEDAPDILDMSWNTPPTECVTAADTAGHAARRRHTARLSHHAPAAAPKAVVGESANPPYPAANADRGGAGRGFVAEATDEYTTVPHLSFFHPNGTGTGAAVRFSVDPATPERDGALFISIAQQKTVGNGRPMDPGYVFPKFDWWNRISVKLSLDEVFSFLFFLNGTAQKLEHARQEGLYHRGRAGTTSVQVQRTTNGTVFINVTRTEKAGGDAAQEPGGDAAPAAVTTAQRRVSFGLSPAESHGLRLALEQTVGMLAFGNVFEHQRRAKAPAGR